MDIFFAAGGTYNSAKLERVMRFRCANVHVEEKGKPADRPPIKLTDNQGRSQHGKKSFYKRSDRRPHRPSHHSSHLAEPAEPNEYEEEENFEEDLEDLDDEDFEAEAMVADDDMEYDDDDEDREGLEDEDLEEVENLKDAYAAGWRAKQKSADTRKARGYSKGPRVKEKAEKAEKASQKMPGRRQNEREQMPERRTRSAEAASNGDTGMEIQNVPTSRAARIHQEDQDLAAPVHQELTLQVEQKVKGQQSIESIGRFRSTAVVAGSC